MLLWERPFILWRCSGQMFSEYFLWILYYQKNQIVHVFASPLVPDWLNECSSACRDYFKCSFSKLVPWLLSGNLENRSSRSKWNSLHWVTLKCVPANQRADSCAPGGLPWGTFFSRLPITSHSYHTGEWTIHCGSK